jgi:hypothetical protein
VSIATGGHSDMTTSNRTKSRNVFLPVIAVDRSPYSPKNRSNNAETGRPGGPLLGLLSPYGFSRWINHRGNGADVPSDHLASGTMKMLNG